MPSFLRKTSEWLRSAGSREQLVAALCCPTPRALAPSGGAKIAHPSRRGQAGNGAIAGGVLLRSSGADCQLRAASSTTPITAITKAACRRSQHAIAVGPLPQDLVCQPEFAGRC